MVIRGEARPGKGISVELLRKIIVDAHFKQVTGMCTSVRPILWSFLLRSCVLCLVDECAWAANAERSAERSAVAAHFDSAG